MLSELPLVVAMLKSYVIGIAAVAAISLSDLRVIEPPTAAAPTLSAASSTQTAPPPAPRGGKVRFWT